MIRILKIVLVVFVGLQALFYALNNIANWDVAVDNVAAVIGMVDHAVYPNAFGPALTSPALATLGLLLILAGEFAVAILAGLGALAMTRAAGASSEAFHASKRLALLGCGMAVIVWFGGFMTIGGAYFQMWQTPLGDGSMTGAFWLTMVNGLVLLIVNQVDD